MRPTLESNIKKVKVEVRLLHSRETFHLKFGVSTQTLCYTLFQEPPPQRVAEQALDPPTIQIDHGTIFFETRDPAPFGHLQGSKVPVMFQLLIG